MQNRCPCQTEGSVWQTCGSSKCSTFEMSKLNTNHTLIPKLCNAVQLQSKPHDTTVILYACLALYCSVCKPCLNESCMHVYVLHICEYTALWGRENNYVNECVWGKKEAGDRKWLTCEFLLLDAHSGTYFMGCDACQALLIKQNQHSRLLDIQSGTLFRSRQPRTQISKWQM